VTAPIQKRKVVMRTAEARPDGSIGIHEATDYVPVDLLDAYVTDARSKWQSVTVPEPGTHDPGPGGDEGATHYPAHLDHPLAGTTVGTVATLQEG
jgi:hypothetical protein